MADQRTALALTLLIPLLVIGVLSTTVAASVLHLSLFHDLYRASPSLSTLDVALNPYGLDAATVFGLIESVSAVAFIIYVVKTT